MSTMAQRHEIEAWLGDDWGMEAKAEVADRIEAAGTDSERDWIRIVTEYEQTDPAYESELRAAHRTWADASITADKAHDTMRDVLVAAVRAGAVTKSKAHQVTGVARTTIDRWLAG